MDSQMIRPVTISGANGQRTPWFSPAIGEIFAKKTLGAVTDQEWYYKAQQTVANYDSYLERLRKLANKQVREDLWDQYVGNPGDAESGVYRRNSVAGNIAEAEAYTPVNYMVFAVERVRNRVAKLEEINGSFRRDMNSAEATYGLLPDPQIVERVIEVRVPGEPAPAAFPTVPVLVVGGAVIIVGLALLGVFSSK